MEPHAGFLSTWLTFGPWEHCASAYGQILGACPSSLPLVLSLSLEGLPEASRFPWRAKLHMQAEQAHGEDC